MKLADAKSSTWIDFMQKMTINILTLKLVHIKYIYIYIYIYKMFEKTYTPNRSEEVLLIEKKLKILFCGHKHERLWKRIAKGKSSRV